MSNVCDNCKWVASNNSDWCFRGHPYSVVPTKRTCDNWEAHPLLLQGIDRERARCLTLVQDICANTSTSERDRMNRARKEGKADAEMFFGHGAHTADELCEDICSVISEDTLYDPVGEATEDEQERCIRVCEFRINELRATADKYPAGTAVCFVAEAQEILRRIKGE